MTFPGITPIHGQPGSGRGSTAMPVRGRGIGGLTVLSIYLVLLCALPSGLTITALGSAGRPAALWALAATLWWCWYQIQRHTPTTRRITPLRIALTIFLGIALISYAWAMLRGLPVDEISPADNGLLRLAGWAGILLVADDGIDDIADLRQLVRRIVLTGGLLGSLGIAQFLTGQSLIGWISIPGTSSDLAGLGSLDSRGGFIRASATAIHPLEYGVVLCIALPLAITLALEDHHRSRLGRWFPVVTIALASVLSVSRSALIGLIVGIIVLLPTWSRQIRILVATIGGAFVIMIGIFIPGLLGTLRGLFTGFSNDPSTLSRSSSFDYAAELLGRFPLVGKGFGTLLPKYHIFDNQYILLAIELGLAGVIAFLALVGSAIVSASIARKSATNRLDRQLGQALVAAIASGAVMMAFFDGLTFPMAAGMLFLVCGLCGSAQRLTESGSSLLAAPGTPLTQPIPIR